MRATLDAIKIDEIILEDVFDIIKNNEIIEPEVRSYNESYPYFLKFFESEIITQNQVVIGAHMVYGWMPTILHFGNSLKESLADVTNILNNARKQKDLLNAKELEKLKGFFNNSMVGTSKLLHFIKPELYPIWDSRVARACNQGKEMYNEKLNNPEIYLTYCKVLEELIPKLSQKEWFVAYKTKFDGISDIRAIEFLLFVKGKEKSSAERKQSQPNTK